MKKSDVAVGLVLTIVLTAGLIGACYSPRIIGHYFDKNYTIALAASEDRLGSTQIVKVKVRSVQFIHRVWAPDKVELLVNIGGNGNEYDFRQFYLRRVKVYYNCKENLIVFTKKVVDIRGRKVWRILSNQGVRLYLS